MPVNIEEVKQDLANHPGRSDFEFPKYNQLKINYGPQFQPIIKKLKLFSWPPEGGILAKKVRIHFGVGQSGKGRVVCPKNSDPEAKCPICDLIEDVTQHGDEIQRKSILPFVLKDRYWFLCLDLSEIEATNGSELKVYIWDAPPMSYQAVATAMQTSWGDFTALPTSYKLMLSSKRDGSSRAGMTDVSGLPEQETIHLEQVKHLFPDLNSITKSPPPAMIEAMLYKAPKAPARPQKQATAQAAVTHPIGPVSTAPIQGTYQQTLPPAAPATTTPFVPSQITGAVPAQQMQAAQPVPAPMAAPTPAPVQPVTPATPPPTAAPVRRSVTDILAAKGK